MFDNGRTEKLAMISEITEIIKLFNTDIDKVLKISDKYVTFGFCSELVKNDISNKLSEYISRK